MILGGAQFGLNYGVSNRLGKVPVSEVASMLKVASRFGVFAIDTAPSYGDSQKVLGNLLNDLNYSFEIITKISDFSSEKEIPSLLHNSLCDLKRSSINSLLFHSAKYLLSEEGDKFWKALSSLKDSGYIKNIGCSVYYPKEVFELLNRYPLDLIQCPLNVLDQRFVKSGCLEFMKSLNTEVHVRSIFLQGALLMKELPKKLKALEKSHKSFRDFCFSHEISPLDLSLCYILSRKEVDAVLFGATSTHELEDILKVYSSFKEDYKELNFDLFSNSDEEAILPINWS